MTDVPSLLGIEAVECLAEGERSVTIRVTGRWRRRRPELRGQPMLVVDTAIGRQRFLAMPEPPSLTGAAPGTWRMSFSVPAELARVLPGRTFLQLGGVMVPLPIGDVPLPAEPPAPVEPPEADLIEARRARGSELAAESARREASELADDVSRLERELDEARVQEGRLRSEIADRDRALRSAQQQAHSERALRAEAEEQLSRQSRAAQHDLRVLHERVAELEHELNRMRRAVDEAQHLAAAAEASRVDAVRRLAERPPEPAVPLSSEPAIAPAPSLPPPTPAPPSPWAGPSQRELDLLRAAVGAPARAGGSPQSAERPGDQDSLRREAAMAESRVSVADARVVTLERELVAAREEVEAHRARSARAYEAIALVRGELRQLREAAQLAAAPSVAGPSVAEPPVSGPPVPAPSIAAPPVAEPPVPAPPSAPLQSDQFSAALARLRDRAPAPELETTPPAPSPETPPTEPPRDPRPAKPWLAPAFRALAARNPSAAGRLLLALLPAQRAADPSPVAYDLIVSDILVAHVTVTSTTGHVTHDATPRLPAEVDFAIVGDLAAIARRLASGRVRRGLLRLAAGRPVASLRGDRRRLAALEHLIGARLTVGQLRAAGVVLDPVLAMTLAGMMIEPAWTEGERFTIAHRDPAATAPDAYLHVRDGQAPVPSAGPPHGPLTTIVVCPGDELLGALAGASPATVEGDERPLALLRQWLDRTQCG